MEKNNILNADFSVEKDDFNLIDILYSSPSHIYSWFLVHSANIEYDDCKKIMLHLN